MVRESRSGNGGEDEDEDEDEDEEYEDLGGPPYFGNEPRPTEPGEVVRGVQRRDLLSDVVLPWDPRFETRQGWDPNEDGFVYNGRDEEEEEDRKSAGFDTNRIARTLETNLDGLFGTNSMTDPEMRRTMRETGRASRAGEAARLPQDVALKLTRRFLESERRALDHEDMLVAAGDLDSAVPPPTRSARGTASDPRRIARVFDQDMRFHDMQHAMRFFAGNAEAHRALRDAITTANETGRRQYGDYARDLLARVQAHIDRGYARGLLEDDDDHDDGEGDDTRPKSLEQKTAPPLADPRVGLAGTMRASARIGHSAPHETMGAIRRLRESEFGATSAAKGPVHPGEIPVFSRAAWKASSMPAGAQQEHYYYERGNTHFLGARLGMRTERSQAVAERDAVRFFAHRFGVDFTGARVDPHTGAMTHPSLPAVLEPYTAASGRLQYVEGHLSTPGLPLPGGGGGGATSTDPLGNGLVTIPAGNAAKSQQSGDDAHGVDEVGWMMRPTSREGIAVLRQGGKGEIRLPPGAMVSTGFWVLNRPGAPPALLRFQSSSPPRVRTVGGGREGDTEITSRYDVYDASHGSDSWPAKGVGRAISTLWRSRTGRHHHHQSRTSVTIHH
mgnify:CR=1 FL=1